MHERRNLNCSPLYSKFLELFLAYYRCSVNICWMKEWIPCNLRKVQICYSFLSDCDQTLYMKSWYNMTKCLIKGMGKRLQILSILGTILDILLPYFNKYTGPIYYKRILSPSLWTPLESYSLVMLPLYKIVVDSVLQMAYRLDKVIFCISSWWIIKALWFRNKFNFWIYTKSLRPKVGDQVQ